MTPSLIDPIILLGSPRSGTSLVASIFASHGVWVGEALRPPDESNKEGYYENEMLAEARYRMGHGPGLDPAVVEGLLLADGYEGGPWAVKHSPPTWRAWRQFKPKWIYIRRHPTEDVIASRMRTGQWLMSPEEHAIAAGTDVAIMELMRRHIGGVEVWSDDVVAGDFADLRHAFRYCGLKFDAAIARSKIKPKLWRRRNVVHQNGGGSA